MQILPTSDDDHVDDRSPVPATSTGTSITGRSGVHETAPPKLLYWQGVALLTADCVGVGILALPHGVRVLGYGIGLTFLILNLPINYFAGDLLSVMALQLEGGAKATDFDLTLHEELDSDDDMQLELPETMSKSPFPSTSTSTDPIDPERSPTMFHRHNKCPPSYGASSVVQVTKSKSPSETFQDEPVLVVDHTNTDEEQDSAAPMIHNTNDLIGISKAIFESQRINHLVLVIYYLNLFLVLGDYILVMGHAVSAMFMDQLCLPTAGAIASLLMFGICQFRTMALLGKNVSVASLLAMLVVLLQCLIHHRQNTATGSSIIVDTVDQEEQTTIWAKFSALASIGFAVGSQKLFLNIRHELQNKDDASRVLAGSLTTYGSAYVLVILLAGSSTYRYS